MTAEALGFMARGANGGRAADLVTRDFLGGCASADDARDASSARNDAVAMPGWVSQQQKHACPPATPRDLNLFPVAAAAATKPCAVTTVPAPVPAPSAAAATSSASAGGATTTYHSVCTIEKVKTALERFERGKQQQQQQSPHPHHQQQHSGAGAGASPSSSSVTTSSVKRRGSSGGGGGVEQGDGCDSPSGGGGGGGGMVAAACPRCFLYVLISRSDPRCPRCESHVPAPPAPAPAASKKPRIDLNVGYLGT